MNRRYKKLKIKNHTITHTVKITTTALCIATIEQSKFQLQIQLMKQLQKPVAIHSVTVKNLTKCNIT